jgi:hypothetical protein
MLSPETIVAIKVLARREVLGKTPIPNDRLRDGNAVFVGDLTAFTSHPLVPALVVPVAVVVIGVLFKSAIKSRITPSNVQTAPSPTEWCMGMELALAAFSTELLYLFRLTSTDQGPILPSLIVSNLDAIPNAAVATRSGGIPGKMLPPMARSIAFGIVSTCLPPAAVITHPVFATQFGQGLLRLGAGG